MAREPLADQLARYTRRAHRDVFADAMTDGYLAQIEERVRTARRVYFSQQASRIVQDLIVDRPADLINNLDAARPPFDSLWCEAGIVPDHWREGSKGSGEPAGFLIDHDLVYNVSKLRFQRGESAIHPTWERYHLNVCWSRAEQDAFFRQYQIEDWRLWVFGKLSDTPAWRTLTDEQCRRVLDRTRIDMIGISQEAREALSGVMNKITLGGSMLGPLACMILLNTPRVIKEVHVPSSRHFASGKLRAFREHTKIEIDVSLDEVVQYITTDPMPPVQSTRRRRHEVRGHFAHNRIARTAACVHVWVRDDARHFHCEKCGGRRWWLDQHERGDEALGRTPPRDYVAR